MAIWKSRHRHLSINIGIGISFFCFVFFCFIFFFASRFFFVEKIEIYVVSCGQLISITIKLLKQYFPKISYSSILKHQLVFYKKGCLNFRNHTPISFSKKQLIRIFLKACQQNIYGGVCVKYTGRPSWEFSKKPQSSYSVENLLMPAYA